MTQYPEGSPQEEAAETPAQEAAEQGSGYVLQPRPMYSVGEHSHHLPQAGSGPTHAQPRGPATHQDKAPDIGKHKGGSQRRTR